MQRYLVRRLLLTLPTLLGVSLTVFLIIRLVPGDVVDLIVGDYGAASPQVKEAIRREYRLDQNVAVQYVSWLADVVRLDLGRSIISNRTVSSELRQRLPVTFELSLLALTFSTTFGIAVGMLAAVKQDTLADYLGRSLAVGLLAVPGFWVAILLITLAGRYFAWGVPPNRYIPFTENPVGNLKMLSVPALIMGIGLSGSVMRFTRSTMLEVLRQDYIRTARAKGLRARTVLVRHTLRNALIPVVTVIGLQLPVLVGGTVIIESIYSIPGMGQYYLTAVNSHDYPIIQAFNLLVATVVVFANLTVDIAYSFLDPRIRYA
jgi:peptide/nickel transport system permease protein